MAPMRMMVLIAVWLCLLAAPTDAQEAELIKGPAVALNGDTLLIADRHVSLFGIDAPEMRGDAHGRWSRAALDDLIADADVTCEVLDKDRRGRPVARCGTAAHADLGAALIARGHALAYRLFTHGDKAPAALAETYDAAERAARAAGVGLWAREDTAAAAADAAWWEDWRLLQIGAAFFGFFLAASAKFGFDLWLDARRRDKENTAFAIGFRAELIAFISDAKIRLSVLKGFGEVDKPITATDIIQVDIPAKPVYANNTHRLGGLGDRAALSVVEAHRTADHIRHNVAAALARKPDKVIGKPALQRIRKDFRRLIVDAAKGINALDAFLGRPERYPDPEALAAEADPAGPDLPEVPTE